MPAGEAQTSTGGLAGLLEELLGGAPGKLPLVLSGRVCASGLFLFPKNTGSISLHRHSDGCL